LLRQCHLTDGGVAMETTTAQSRCVIKAANRTSSVKTADSPEVRFEAVDPRSNVF
jgi:hypothetical protein